jgi:hypothetical protein
MGRSKGWGSKEFRFQTLVFYSAGSRNGVGILIEKSLKNGVVVVLRPGDRIILIKLVVGDLVLNIISAYASQVGLDSAAKRQFCKTWRAWLVVYR